MKKLDKTIKYCWFVYNQIERTEKVAIYEQCYPEGGVVGYEVFLIREQKECKAKMGGSIVKFEHKEQKGYEELRIYIKNLLHKFEEIDWDRNNALNVNIDSLDF